MGQVVMQINFTIDFAKMNNKIKKHLPVAASAIALMGLALLFTASAKRRVQERRAMRLAKEAEINAAHARAQAAAAQIAALLDQQRIEQALIAEQAARDNLRIATETTERLAAVTARLTEQERVESARLFKATVRNKIAAVFPSAPAANKKALYKNIVSRQIPPDLDIMVSAEDFRPYCSNEETYQSMLSWTTVEVKPRKPTRPETRPANLPAQPPSPPPVAGSSRPARKWEKPELKPFLKSDVKSRAAPVVNGKQKPAESSELKKTLLANIKSGKFTTWIKPADIMDENKYYVLEPKDLEPWLKAYRFSLYNEKGDKTKLTEFGHPMVRFQDRMDIDAEIEGWRSVGRLPLDVVSGERFSETLLARLVHDLRGAHSTRGTSSRGQRRGRGVTRGYGANRDSHRRHDAPSRGFTPDSQLDNADYDSDASLVASLLNHPLGNITCVACEDQGCGICKLPDDLATCGKDSFSCTDKECIHNAPTSWGSSFSPIVTRSTVPAPAPVNGKGKQKARIDDEFPALPSLPAPRVVVETEVDVEEMKAEAAARKAELVSKGFVETIPVDKAKAMKAAHNQRVQAANALEYSGGGPAVNGD